ncbi:hypothetical protein [Propioniciclava tarda]|uniref:NACHT domain-containing protein n=1 Tax=Propioniciclava tarda TaxID=433330 RepID=A0A4Q9KHU7_PROTD|nr:hypothetical protein [Propioniciclava tarda]TBT92148.1 hypothetical protein ET996_13270 [Propioniciclava tarda]SMO85452.1 hypothetical protein SAMN06266982_1264 [Propioniciclava tarda]
MILDDIYLDLSAFADDEQDVVIENDGSFLLVREGRDIAGKLVETESGVFVELGADRIPYRQFLIRTLGRLDVFATRILQRKGEVPSFVEGPAVVFHPAEAPVAVSSALLALEDECATGSPFATRISFITADAGLGKTALLQQMQARRAQQFLEGRSGFIFWHLDLQGRQLLRLSEALMGDLGDLRMYGLWMPGLIRLMKHRALVLAIDGFDELSAEQGSNTSLGALASLVAQLDGQGTIVAAARRTFFDTEDYMRRAGVVKRSTTSPCEFAEITVRPWREREAVEFLGSYATSQGFDTDGRAIYTDILTALGCAADHPFLTRPFLLSRAARAIVEYSIPVEQFIRPGEDQLDSVAAIVHAFVEREVTEKWKNRVTGEPYLSSDQHMELLAQVAEEMYQNATDRLPVEIIDTIASILLEAWAIDAEYRQQVVEMVHMHVLLVHPSDGVDGYRSFDHPEFRDYFVAVALSARLREAMNSGVGERLARFLSISQLSDSTARYVFGMIKPSRAESARLLQVLADIVNREYRPTYVQQNVGTLLPFALSDSTGGDQLAFAAKAISSSISWESTHLTDISLSQVTFVNVSLQGSVWTRVTLEDCQLGDLAVDAHSRFEDVVLKQCQVDSVRFEAAEDSIREFAPARIKAVLSGLGIVFHEDEEPKLPIEEPASVGAIRSLLSMFRRSTVVRESQIRHRFRSEAAWVLDELVGVAVAHGVIEVRTYRGSGQDRIWALTARLDDVLAAEGGFARQDLVDFWADLRGRR